MKLTNIERLNIATEHNPYSLAAACILFVVEINEIKCINKKKLAAEFNISDVTISKARDKLEPYKNIILDDSKVDEMCNEIENLYNNEIDTDIPDEIKEQMKEYGIISDSEFKKQTQNSSKTDTSYDSETDTSYDSETDTSYDSNMKSDENNLNIEEEYLKMVEIQKYLKEKTEKIKQFVF